MTRNYQCVFVFVYQQTEAGRREMGGGMLICACLRGRYSLLCVHDSLYYGSMLVVLHKCHTEEA
jgi:hypothetical protein